MARRSSARSNRRAGDRSVAPSSHYTWLPRAQEYVQSALAELSSDWSPPGDLDAFEEVYPRPPRRPARLWTTLRQQSSRSARRYVMPRFAVARPGDFRELRRLSIRVPSRVRFCVARKERREVLFALRKAGFGGSARKKHWYRNASSQYRC